MANATQTPTRNTPPVIVEEGEYQGRPTLTLMDRHDSKYPFSFGLGKARMIVDAIDQIRAFVAKHQK